MITRDQRSEFDEAGFIHLCGMIDPALLVDACDAVMRIVQEVARRRYADRHNDLCQFERGGENYVSRVNHLHRHAGFASLRLAGLPELRGVAEELCGRDAIAMYESAVIKSRGDGERFAWHRDMLHDRSSRIVTIGIYLTESCAADGGLMVIPGSQHDRRDIAAIVREREAEAIGISAAPGDMVVHDTMLVHSSTALRERARRITLYFEFREAAHVVSNERFSSSWRNARRDLQRLERICSEGPRFGIAHLIEQCYAQSAAIEPAQY